jgi:hypothetical protein
LTISKSLSIVGIATLPLAVLTVVAFRSTGERAGVAGGVPSVPASVVRVRDKATAALRAKAAAETAAEADPAGFLAKAGDAALTEPPYSTAARLAEAEVAARADDLDRTTRALADLADESMVPDGLRGDFARRRQLLERHATWLRNRTVASDALRLADETLRAPASIPNAAKAADTLEDLRRRLPQVAKADTAADEPGDALTVEEAAEASRLRQWAAYRSEFLSMKSKRAGLDNDKPDVLKSVVEGWDRFLTRYDRAGVPDPDDCIGESKRLRTEAQLAFLWARAIACVTSDTLAPAVLDWLDEPRSAADGGGDDPDRRGQATSLLRAWLESNLPSPPRLPDGLAGMQEGIVDDQQAGKRLIAIFQAVPEQPRRYRYWHSAAERKDLPLGKDSWFLQDPPAPPKCIGWATRYGQARDAYLAGFMVDDDSFASECRALAEACRNHMQLLPLDPQNDIMAPVADWAELFSAAANRSAAFQRACRESGLKERIRTQSP